MSVLLKKKISEQVSVDARMAKEMAAGREVVVREGASLHAVVDVNAGGPYGSSMLSSVLEASEQVRFTECDGC